MGLHLESEADCWALCDLYGSIGQGCTFTAWSEWPFEPQNCRIYRLPFWQYLSTCRVLAGPADLTGCQVEHPEDNTCDAVT